MRRKTKHAREHQETDEKRFQALAKEWRNATDFLSSPSKRVTHPAYLQIISMGEAAVPYILRDLRDRGGDWYSALRTITGQSPVPPDAQGDVELMDKAWLDWGRRRGYAF